MRQDVFSVDSGLSYDERLLVASYIRQKADQYDASEPRRAELLRNEADRFSNCRKNGVLLQCPHDYLYHFVRSSCRSRICEGCGYVYVEKLKKTIWPALSEIRVNPRRGYVLSLVTLTVTSKRYGDQLPDSKGIARLYRESTALLNRFYGKYAVRQSKSGRWYEDRKRYIGAGWLAAVEVGRDNNNLHIHALVYGPIRPQRLLKAAWIETTGDSFGVDIRKRTPSQAVSYVLKYIGKPPTTDSYQRMAEYADMIKGSRRFRSGGIFFGRFKVVKEERQPLTCRVCGSFLRYVSLLKSVVEAAEAGYIDYYKAKQCEIDDLIKGFSFLPGGATPTRLPF